MHLKSTFVILLHNIIRTPIFILYDYFTNCVKAQTMHAQQSTWPDLTFILLANLACCHINIVLLLSCDKNKIYFHFLILKYTEMQYFILWRDFFRLFDFSYWILLQVHRSIYIKAVSIPNPREDICQTEECVSKVQPVSHKNSHNNVSCQSVIFSLTQTQTRS